MNALLQAATTGGSHTIAGMVSAGTIVLVLALFCARSEIAESPGWDRVVALRTACVAAPLAVFGALHVFGPQFVTNLVPVYMPVKMFWVYGVGVALIAAALSIATGIAVRWSGLLAGIMMFAFVAMIHLPGALRHPEMTRLWVICSRELCFGGAGWILAGPAWARTNVKLERTLVTVGRVLITIAIVFYGVQHFLHPTLLPGVPLEKQIPEWIPARELIDYITGAALLIAGASIVVGRNARTVTTALGLWLVTMVLVLYGPIMISALTSTSVGEQLVGVNYFADTLLFAGAILALASAAPRKHLPA